MESSPLEQMDHDTLLALLAWQVEMGIDEAVGDLPVNRYDVPTTPPADTAAAPVLAAPGIVSPARVDWVSQAEEAARKAQDLNALRAAIAAFDGCDLKKGARNAVFSDGDPGARVMVIGDAPDRDEDRVGKPFVGSTGRLLDRMFAAIGLSREAAGADGLYVTTVLPWHPPRYQELSAEDVAMMRPFVQRHVELADPTVLILMGNDSCGALLGRRGVTKLRGTWASAFDRPALPMFHPDVLLRNPLAKRDAWHDLLMLQARLLEPE